MGIPRGVWIGLAGLVFLAGGTIGAIWLINTQNFAPAPAEPVKESAPPPAVRPPVARPTAMPLDIQWVYTGTQTRIRVRIKRAELPALRSHHRIRIRIPEYEIGETIDPHQDEILVRKDLPGSRHMPEERLTIQVHGVDLSGAETLLYTNR